MPFCRPGGIKKDCCVMAACVREEEKASGNRQRKREVDKVEVAP